jgi:hypothetical protein
MSITTTKKYSLINNIIKIDNDKVSLILQLKNLLNENFIFDEESQLWIYSYYKSNKKLINILYPNEYIKSIEFKNNDVNDYRTKNIIITYNNKYYNNFILPPEYELIEAGTSILILASSKANQYRNMYWKVKDNNNDIYYLMHIKNDIYTKISIEDINIILNFNEKRNIWYIHKNRKNQYTYIGTNNNGTQYYLHQIILGVHNTILKDTRMSVDHINRDKLDNRRDNLRLTDWSTQNSNKDMQEDRCDKVHEWPVGTKRVKYLQYRPDYADNREYYYIDHPKLNGIYETSKSNKITYMSKYNDALNKLEYLNSLNKMITKEELIEYFNDNTKLDLPTYIRLDTRPTDNKLIFIYDYKDNDNERKNYRQVIKNINPQIELDRFIDNINIKYPDLNFLKYTIKNINYKFNDNNISKEKYEIDINKPIIKLPPNYSLYLEKNKYYIAFSKNIMKKRYCMKITTTTDYHQDYKKLTNLLNEKYPELKLDIINIL